MADASDVTIDISASAVPILPGTFPFTKKGYLTAGGGTNRRFVEGEISWDAPRDEKLEHVLYDPQTSGGLFISVPQDKADALLAAILPECPDAAIVGDVRDKSVFRLRIV
jgi:selenide,water dikinase